MDDARRKLVIALPLALPFAAPALAETGNAAAPAQSAPPAALVVSGAVRRPMRPGAEELRGSPLTRPLDPIALTNASGVFKRMLDGYRGMKLTDLLDQAQLEAAGHNDWKRTFVVARATDGYTVLFSWSELYNTPVGQSVFVLLEKDGAPLPNTEGPVALVSARDLKTGPRHVRSLASLEVLRVPAG